MPFVELWDLSDADARAFAGAYWAAQQPCLDRFTALTGIAGPVTGETLVAASRWVIQWWFEGGGSEDGGPYPMWFLPPSLPRHEGELKAPALQLADALGYLWLDYVEAALPDLNRGVCKQKTLSFHKPSVWIAPERSICPFDHGYNMVLGIREDAPTNKHWRAGRDPERLLQLADSWIEKMRALPAPRTTPPPSSASPAGADPVGTELSRHGLSWPLHTIEIDEERNAEAGRSEPQELYVVFDDVAGYEYEQEIDALADHLATLRHVLSADREDREFILIELKPPHAAKRARKRIDNATRDFMRAAILQRAR
jgi:hypothetical protein